MAEGGNLAPSTADCTEASDTNDRNKRGPESLGDTWIPPSPLSQLSPDHINVQVPLGDSWKPSSFLIPTLRDESKFKRLEKSLHDFKLGLLEKYWKDFEHFIRSKHPGCSVELINQRIVLTGPENVSGRANFLESFLQYCLKKELKVLNTEDLVEIVTKKNPKAYIDSVLQDKKIDCYWSKCSQNKRYVQIYATTQEAAENAGAVISLCAFRLELILEFSDQFMYYMEKEFPFITTEKDEVGCPIVADEDEPVTHIYLGKYIDQLFQKVYQFPSSLHAEFFCSKDSRDHFAKKLKKKNIKCFWCKDPYDAFDTECIKVYVQMEEDIEKIFQLIKQSLADYSVVVTSDQRQLLDWKLHNLTQKNESKYVFRVREENAPNRYKYTFVGFAEATKAIQQSMVEVTAENNPSEEHGLNQGNLAAISRKRTKSMSQCTQQKKKSQKRRPLSQSPLSAVDRAGHVTERVVWKGGNFPFHEAEKKLNSYCKFTHAEGFVCESELTLMDKYTFVYKNKKIVIQEGCIADSQAHLIMCPVNKDLKEFGVGTNIFERGGREQLEVAIYSVVSLSKQQEIGTCHFSEETGTLACREICYVVLPESPTVQPSQLTRFISSCVTKMLEHSEKKFYKSVAMCVDFMNIKDKRSNDGLIQTFVTAVKRSNFQKGTKLFQGSLKNVLEIHLIGQDKAAVDCLKAGVEKSKSIKATHILDMSHSQFNLKDELLLKSAIALQKVSGSLTDPELLKNVDMVINSIDPSCMFESGLVNMNIFHAAGPQIRDELRQNYPELLKPGEVAITSAGKLSCKKICHGLLYQGWDDISIKLVRSIIIKSLKKADEFRFAIVAFPALGTGTLGYPWQLVANTMVECIDHYGKSNPETKVKTVFFVLYSEDKPTQQVFDTVFKRREKFPNCTSFYPQKVQRELDKKEPFIVSVDPKGVGKFHVIPSHLIGVCFDVDIIYTFVDSQGFEDSVEKCKLQQPLRETWKFDETKNVFDVTIQLDKDAMRSSENLLSQAVKNCLLPMDIYKFTSLAIHVQETGFVDICKRIELLAKLIQKQKGEKTLNVYFIVDQVTDYEHNLLKPLNGTRSDNTRGLLWHLKHCALRNHTTPAVELTLEANSQENLQKAVNLLQNLKNEYETKSHRSLEADSLQIRQSAKRLSNTLDEVQVQEDAEDEERPSELHECCFEGNLEKMKELLQRLDTDEINQPDSEGDTAVHCCAHWKNEEILQMLLERRDVKLNEVNMNGMTALEICMEEEAEDCAKLLVQKGCDVNIVNTDGYILLHLAIEHSKSEILQIVLSSPTADFKKENNDGLNALMWATLKNSTEAVDLILEQDKGLVNVQTVEGFTPVHAAATNNFMEVASILLTKGEVDTKLADNEQKTPLHVAVIRGFESMIDLLVFKGYDVNAQDCNGNTPLHVAQICSENESQETCDGYIRDRKNTARILCHLIELRANIHVKNNAGITPLEGISDYLTQQFIVSLSATVNASAQALSRGGITLPCHWEPMDGERYKKIPLNPDKPGLMQMEYRDIEALFMESFHTAKVLSICRVQNPYLWEHYILKKKNMERQYGKGCSNEKELFHGTRHTNIERICEENLEMCRASERTGAILGLGVYFAVESQTSDLYCTSTKDGKRFMMVMRVAVGKICKGNQSYKKPPLINPGNPDSKVIYDSCVDSVDRPKVFCLFDQNQYYPDYVIEYTTQ